MNMKQKMISKVFGMYGGKYHTEEWRKKHSEALKGRKHTEETKAKMRHPHKKRK